MNGLLKEEFTVSETRARVNNDYSQISQTDSNTLLNLVGSVLTLLLSRGLKARVRKD